MLPTKCFTVRPSWPISPPSIDDAIPKPLSGPEAERLFEKCLKTHFGQFEFDPETMIEVESCLQLSCPASETESSEKVRSKCELTFEASMPNVSVTKFVLASECKRAEVYGPQGEYKLTKEGVLLDDSDPDMILFLVEVDFSKLKLSNFCVKLTGLEDKCWILALHLGLDRSQTPSFPLSTTRFNLQEMNQLLGDEKLSEKAKEFKQLFENFQKSQPGSMLAAQTSFFPPAAMTIPPQSSFLPMAIPSQLGSFLSSQSQLSLSEPNSEQKLSQSEKPCEHCSIELQKIEERLTKKIDDLHKIQNEKLDKIMGLLVNSELNKT